MSFVSIKRKAEALKIPYMILWELCNMENIPLFCWFTICFRGNGLCL